MGIIGGQIGYSLLKTISPRKPTPNTADPYTPDTNLPYYFGDDFIDVIQGKTVIDFGCGRGFQAVEMAKRGAGKVIGLDIQEKMLSIGVDLAKKSSVNDRCIFTNSTNELADIIVSLDAFEHFSNPAVILQTMYKLLKPTGKVLISFGPTWLHPNGGHLFSIFPWAHLVFTEEALIRWRSDFKSDGATRFSEVEGGLNQLTIYKFEQIVEKSPFTIELLDTEPIRGISILKHKLFREVGSSFVRCKLAISPDASGCPI